MSNIVLGTIDAGGDGKAVLLANINSVLGTSYTLDEFDFGTPELVTISSPTRNSVVRLAPKAVSGYYGTRKVYYNRIHGSELGTISVARGSATSVSGLLTAINEKYGILITSADIYDATLPAAPVGEVEVTVALDFRPGSFIYYGGAQIVLGTNDPNAGSGTQAPFSGVQTLFSWSKETADNWKVKVDGFSIVLDQDKNRKRIAALDDSAQDYSTYLRRLWNGDWEVDKASFSGTMPVVGSFITGGGKTRAVDTYGAVYEMDSSWSGWGSQVSSVMAGLDLTDHDTIVDLQQKQPLKGVWQDSTGAVLALEAHVGFVQFKRSVNDGSTFTPVSNLVPGSTWALDAQRWTDGLECLDSVILGSTVYLLVKFGQDPVHVESFNMATGECLVLEIGTGIALSGQVANLQDAKMAFMTPVATMTKPMLVVVAPFENTAQPMVFMAVSTGVNYTLNAVKHSLLPYDFLNDPACYVSGYSIDIVKNPAWRLDVLEIGTRVGTATANIEYATLSKERTLTGYTTYGIKSLTSIYQGAARTQWVETDSALQGGHKPTPIRLYSPGKTMQYHLQPENSLVRVKYVESVPQGGFVAELDTSIFVDKSSQWRQVAPHGSAVYVRPTITENVTTNYTTLPITNIDAAKPDLEYSFIGKNANNVRTWLTAAASATPLVARTYGSGYGNHGSTPVAVANMDDRLFIVTDSNVVLDSLDKGKTWRTYCDARSYYYQRDVFANRDIGSTAPVPWTSDSFKGGNFYQDRLIFEVDHTVQANVLDKLTKAFSEQKTFRANTLVRFSAADVGTAYSYETLEIGLSHGLNYLGDYMPTQVKYWRADIMNDVTMTVRYTDDAATELNQTDIGIPSLRTFPVGSEILDTKTDFLYMDSKEISLVKSSANVYRLEGVRSNDTTFTFDLAGGSRPSTATFTPELSFYLWDYQETNYVPLVYYANKSVVLIERLTEDASFIPNIYHLSIPQDNGSTLVPFPMFNKNRREYYFYQKGNGIFTLTYLYNNVSRTVTFGLSRIFALSDPALNALDIVSGCKLAAPVAVMPTVPLIPSYIPAGTLVSWACSGTTKVGNYADGSGGTYQQTIELNSLDCGYVAPTPGPVEAATATITINSATNQDVNTEVVIGEDGTAYIVYDLSNPLTAATDLVFNAAFAASATADDIATVSWRAGAGAWNTITFPATVTVPQGTSDITLRITYVEDLTTEGDETYTVTLDKAMGNTQITSGPIVTEMTIFDTSIAGFASARFAMIDDLESGEDNITNVTADENGNAYVSYRLNQPLNAQTSMIIRAEFNAEADANDVQETAWRVNDGPWFAFALPSATIVLQPGSVEIGVRVKVRDDHTTEGVEHFDLILDKAPGNTNIENEVPIVATITINDTSTNPTKTFALTTPASVTVNEGGTAEFFYELSESNIAPLQYMVTTSGSITSDDITSFRWSYDGTTWNTIAFPSGSIVLASDSTAFRIQVVFAEDLTTEGTETLGITLTRSLANTEFSADPISTTITVNDTSLTPVSAKSITFLADETPPTINEGGIAYFYYEFSEPPASAVGYTATFGGTVNASDITNVVVQWRINYNSWTTPGQSINLPGNGSFTVPTGADIFRLCVYINADSVTEGSEQLDVTVTRSAGYTEFLPQTVNASVTINDTSVQVVPKDFVVTAAPADTSEGGSTQIGYGTSTGATVAIIGMSYEITGAATAADFDSITLYYNGGASSTDLLANFPESSFTLPSGTSSFYITLVLKADGVAEGNEAVTVTIQRVSGDTSFSNTPVVASFNIIDVNAETVLYEDDFVSNNKSFHTGTYASPGGYGAFYDPATPEGSVPGRDASYDNTNHQLILTQDSQNYYITNDMFVRPNNFLDYKTTGTMVFNAVLSPVALATYDDTDTLVWLPAGTNVIPGGHYYAPHKIGIGFINTLMVNGTGTRGFYIELNLLSSGSVINSSVGIYRMNNNGSSFSKYGSILQAATNINNIVLPNETEYNIKATVTRSGWDAAFNIEVNGNNLMTFYTQVRDDYYLTPTLDLGKAAWNTMHLKKFKITTP